MSIYKILHAEFGQVIGMRLRAFTIFQIAASRVLAEPCFLPLTAVPKPWPFPAYFFIGAMVGVW